MTQSQASAPLDSRAAGDATTHDHVVQVHVNNRPVDIPGPKTTGASVKAAAIMAGLPIKADFILIEERPNSDDKTIGDHDPVTVNKQSKFTAVAPDDNS